MASSYSPKLRFELIAPGEQAGLWGDTTNNNMGELIEQAIAGVANIDLAAKSGDVVLEAKDGTLDQARSAVLSCFGAAAGDVNLVIPSSTKLYVVRNSSSKDVYVKTASQLLGTKIGSGEANLVYCDGANAQAGIVIAGASVAPVSAGGTGVGSPGFTAGYLKSPGGTTAFQTVSGIPAGDIVGQVGVAQGGTGISTTPTAGQVLIGTSGGGYAAGSITGSGGITVSSSSGAINISSSGGGAVTSVNSGTNISVSPTTGSVTVSTVSNPTFSSSVTSPYHYVGNSAGSMYMYDNGGQLQFIVGGLPSAKVTSAGIGCATLVAQGDIYGASVLNASGSSGVLPDGSIRYGNSSSTMFLASGAWNVAINGAFPFTLNQNGNGYAAGSWISSSDARIKENISPLTNSLNKINQLNPVKFSYTRESLGAANHYGLIAQEVEQLIPEVVSTSSFKEGDIEDIKAIAYTELVPLLIKSVQELSAKITALEEQVLNLGVK